MRRVLLAAAVALLSAPALAQYAPPPPPSWTPPPPPSTPPPPPQALAWPAPPKNHLTLAIGWTGLSSGYYCAYYYGYCYDYYSLSYWPFTVRGDFDIGLSRGMSLDIGVDYLNGSSYDRAVSIWQPTADLRWNFPTYGSRSRFYVGVGIPINERGNTGVAGRLGFGSTLAISQAAGIALDLILGFGSMNGYQVGTLAFLIGPEFGL
jgi:hypothetical protein